MALRLSLLPGAYTLHRLSAEAEIPPAALRSPFFAITRTEEELSLVLPSSVPVKGDRADPGWACFKVEGPLAFNQVGVLAGISGALADAEVSIYAISTFDTDYILVKRAQVQAAQDALLSAGYRIQNGV